MAGLERGVWKTMLVTGLLAVVALGCGGDADVATREESAAGGAPGVGYADAVELFATPEEAPTAILRLPGAASPQASTPARPRMLIRSGTAVVEVDAIDTSVEAVRLLAERMGGFLAGVNVSGGSDVTRAASLTLRIPADRWDETLAALDSLGEVESVYISTEDVGETYADLEVRVANARRLEERLLDLLATRTGSLEDVLAVERELARVREEVERMDAQLRSMRDRVDMSTLTAQLHEPEPLFSSGGGGNVVVRAFRQAGRNFVGFVAGFIASLGVILPLLLLVMLAWWGWRGLRRRRRRSAGFEHRD